MRRTIESSVIALVLGGCATGSDPEDAGFRGETEGHESSSSSSSSSSGGEEDDDGPCDEDGCDDDGDDDDDCEDDCDHDCGDEGCVRTQGYWKNHSSQDGQHNNQTAWPIDESTPLCGSTWYDWLWVQPEGDAWIILVHQWIAASLNVAAGASVPADVQDALDTADGIVAACAVADEDRDTATELATILDEYNNGNAGVSSCP
jgi:hypothetical protein